MAPVAARIRLRGFRSKKILEARIRFRGFGSKEILEDSEGYCWVVAAIFYAF